GRDPPGTVWETLAQMEAAAAFPDGIGLGIATSRSAAFASELRVNLFDNSRFERTRIADQLLAEAMIARCEAGRARHAAEVLSARQIWFDFVLESRAQAQEVMDGQAEIILNLEDQLKKAKQKAAAPKDGESSKATPKDDES